MALPPSLALVQSNHQTWWAQLLWMLCHPAICFKFFLGVEQWAAVGHELREVTEQSLNRMSLHLRLVSICPSYFPWINLTFWCALYCRFLFCWFCSSILGFSEFSEKNQMDICFCMTLAGQNRLGKRTSKIALQSERMKSTILTKDFATYWCRCCNQCFALLVLTMGDGLLHLSFLVKWCSVPSFYRTQINI